jgi:hypothetical protein
MNCSLSSSAAIPLPSNRVGDSVEGIAGNPVDPFHAGCRKSLHKQICHCFCCDRIPSFFIPQGESFTCIAIVGVLALGKASCLTPFCSERFSPLQVWLLFAPNCELPSPPNSCMQISTYPWLVTSMPASSSPRPSVLGVCPGAINTSVPSRFSQHHFAQLIRLHSVCLLCFKVAGTRATRRSLVRAALRVADGLTAGWVQP